jgi:hypothetical protein
MLNPESRRRHRRVRRAGRILTGLVLKHDGDKEAIEKELEFAIPWVLLLELAFRLLPILLDIYFHCEAVEIQGEEEYDPQKFFERCAKGKIRSLADICSTDQECIAWTAEDAEDDDMPLDARLFRWVSSNFELISDEMDEGFDD